MRYVECGLVLQQLVGTEEGLLQSLHSASVANAGLKRPNLKCTGSTLNLKGGLQLMFGNVLMKLLHLLAREDNSTSKILAGWILIPSCPSLLVII